MPDFQEINRLQQQVLQTNVAPTPFNVSPTVSYQDAGAGRYPNFYIGLDNEDIYGQNQGTLDKWKNAAGKFAATTASTFVQGTAGLVNGLYNWVQDGKFSSFYDNDLNKGLDSWTQGLENSLPNYYTKAESTAAWYSPKTWGTANFWADSVFKNAGFALGAYLSGAAWSKLAGGAVSAISKGFAEGDAVAINESLQGAKDLTDISTRLTQTANRSNQFAKAIDFGKNATRAGMATFGEASIEALNAKDQYKKELITQYQNTHGYEPTTEDLAHIEELSDTLGNGTFAANVALLSVTNYIQFPKLSGLLWKDARQTVASQGLNAIERVGDNVLNETLQTAEKTTTKLGRILSTSKGFARAFFSPSEAFEEGAQYAIPITIKDYINKGESKEPRDIYTSLVEGIKRTLTDREGQLSILIGGLSGGVMETGGRLRRGEGLITGRFEQNQRNTNTQNFIKQANQFTLESYVRQGVESMNRTQSSLENTQQAILDNDRLSFEDGKTDGIISYLMPRIQNGRFDLVQDDIQGYKNLASTPDGWQQLISNGIVTQETDKENFLQNLDRLQQTSENLNTQFDYLKTKYPTYNPQTLGYMAYAGAKIDDYNKRLGQLIPNMGTIDIQSYIDKVNNNTITEDDFMNLNQEIENSTKNQSPEVTDQVRESARDILELTARRNLKIEEYQQIKTNPEEYTPAQKDAITNKPLPEENQVQPTEEPYQGDLTDQEYNDFVDNNEISAKVLEGIADKVRQNLPLTEKETAVFAGRTEDINNILKEYYQQVAKDNLQQIRDYHTEAIQRQGEIQSQIENRKEQLQNIQDELKIEQWNAEEAVARKKGWFPKFVNSIQALTELRDEEQSHLDNLNQENEQLVGYIQELQNILDNPPTNLIKLQDDIKSQQTELENLILDNGNSINTLSGIIKSTQDLINRLKGIIQDKLRLFSNRNINPLVDTAIRTLDQDTPNTDILRQVQEIEDFQIAPATRREQQTIGEIKDLYKQIDDYSKQIAAKQQVLDRINQDLFPILNPVEDEKVLEDVKPVQEINPTEPTIEEDGISTEQPKNEIPDEPIIPKYNRNQDKKETSEDDVKKPLPILFKSTVIPNIKEATWYKRFDNFTKGFRFLTSRQKANSRAIYVTASNEESLGLKGLIESTTGDFYEKNDISLINLDQGRILSVIVEVDTQTGQHYFVDSRGNRLTEVGKEADISKVVTAPMPNTSDEWENYAGQRYADRPGYKIEDEVSSYRNKRQAIFNGEYDNKPIPFEVSRGKEDKNITNPQNIVDKLISKDQVAQVGLLQIKGSREINNVAGEPIKGLLPTDVIINNGDAIEKVYTHSLDADNIANLFTSLDKRADQRVVDFLQGQLYMKEELNWINLDTKTATLNGKDYKFSDSQGIKEALKEQFHHINRDLLNSKEPFSEMIADQDGNLTERPYQNYQAYLISPKTVEGENRTAPIYTFANKFTDKYIVLQDQSNQGEKQEDNQPIAPSEIKNSQLMNSIDDLKVKKVIEYDEISKNKFKPNEQLRFAQGGINYEAVVIVADPELIELYRATQSKKNNIPLERRYELQSKFGVNGFEVVDRFKEIAKENRSEKNERIVVLTINNDTTITPEGLPEINLCI